MADELDAFLDEDVDAFLDGPGAAGGGDSGVSSPKPAAPGSRPARPDFEVTASMGIDPKMRSVYQALQRDPEQFSRDVSSGARTALTTAPALIAAPFTGGMSLLARTGIQGALGAAGSLASEAVDPSSSLGQAAGRVALGAGAGAGGEVLGSAAGATLAKVGPSIGRYAETQAAKALGAIQSELRKLGIGRAREVGREALDSGVVSAFASPETMLKRAEAVNDVAGQTLDRIRNVSDANGGWIGVNNMSARITKELQDWVPGSSVEQAYKAQLGSIVQDVQAYGQGGVLNASRLAQLKKLVADQVYTDPLISAENLRGVLKPRAELARGALQGAEEEVVEGAAPQLFPDFLANKRTYGATEDMRDLLTGKFAREEGNRGGIGGMSAMLAGLAGTASGGPAVGMGTALGGRFLSRRGAQISSTAADSLFRLATNPNTTAATRTAAQGILQAAKPEDPYVLRIPED